MAAKSAIEELKGKTPEQLKKMGEELARDIQKTEGVSPQAAAAMVAPPGTTPAAAAAGQTSDGNNRSNIDKNAVIEVLVYNNPKRGVSRDRYAHYRTGMTVGEYVKLAGTKGMPDIRWDQERHGQTPLIKLHPAGTKLADAGKKVTS